MTFSRLEGAIDRIEDGWILGWASNREYPSERLCLRVRLDGRQVAALTADMYRADLEHAGKGDGRHAFEVELPRDFSVGEAHTVRVVHDGRDIPGSPAALPSP